MTITKCLVITFSTDLNIQILCETKLYSNNQHLIWKAKKKKKQSDKPQCKNIRNGKRDVEGTSIRSSRREMGEERSINILLPLEMLEKIFCQLSFETLKVCVNGLYAKYDLV